MSILFAIAFLGLLVLILYQRRQVAGLVARLSDATKNDPLTGLLNRWAFEERLDSELERSRRSGGPLSVIVSDVDGLAHVNGERGRPAGDAVLKLVARDMQKWKRRVDSAARITGEEFALLLPETDGRGALLVAERLRRAAHRTFGDEATTVTLSFGVASHPEHGSRIDELMAAAARALAAAKALGKDRSVVYGTEMARASAGEELSLAALVGLAEALDVRDTGTTGHSHAVARYAELIGGQLGLPRARVERVRLAGLLHDVGKVAVSEQVTHKPGPLDADEWRQMRTHPALAARLLAGSEFDDLRGWVLAHHERPDGRGYPHGLEGGEIPLEARILAVADAYEAMTADRSYRPALGEEAARAELQAGAGTQFDAEVVRAFLVALSREGKAHLSRAS